MRPCILLQSIRERGDKRPQVKRSFFTSRCPYLRRLQKYGYGILTLTFGPNVIYYHEGEMPGYQSFMGYDLASDVTLVIWTNLTIALDGQATANTLMVKILDEIYTVSPLQEAK